MYSIEMPVKDEHIDFQEIVDGLYYPFYFEEVRHKFIKEVLGVDLEQTAKEGTNWVVAEYTLKFVSPLKRRDKITVSYQLVPIEGSRSTFGFSQTILRDGKAMATAFFVVTCVPAVKGRPFIPECVLKALAGTEKQAETSH
jgi:acyl-CoA thioester hydrolase